MHFVKKANWNECQWFHCIQREKVAAQGKEVLRYHLTEMIIPEQTVAGATVSTDLAEGTSMMGIYTELRQRFAHIEDRVERNAACNAIIKSMHVWAHSHVKMASSPSGRDNNTFRTWCQQNAAQGVTSPFMMMIVNQRGEVYTRIYDPEYPDYLFVHSPIVIGPVPYEVDMEYIENALNSKIKSIPRPTYPKYSQLSSGMIDIKSLYGSPPDPSDTISEADRSTLISLLLTLNKLPASQGNQVATRIVRIAKTYLTPGEFPILVELLETESDANTNSVMMKVNSALGRKSTAAVEGFHHYLTQAIIDPPELFCSALQASMDFATTGNLKKKLSVLSDYVADLDALIGFDFEMENIETEGHNV